MKRIAVPVATVALLVVLAGCGSSDGDTEDKGGSGASADTTTAKSEIEPYLSAPTDFPITEPLDGSVDGKTVAWLDCGTPVCGLGWTNVENASKALGLNATRVDAGLQAETIKDAFDTVTAQGVDAAMDPALPNPLAQSGLEALTAEGIPAVGVGVVNGDRDLLPAIVGSEVALSRLGELTASYMVATYGDDVNTVFYTVPELELTQIMYDAFEEKLTELCPDCEVRSAEIPVASLGTTAPTVITDDLQAHPDTKQAAFSVGEEAIGLPAALKTAGIEVDTVAAGPGPDSFQQIKDGDMAAAIGYDLTYVGWAATDSAARLILGQDMSKAVQDDIVPMQILTADSVTDEMIQFGWSAYPDIADRFSEIWGVN